MAGERIQASFSVGEIAPELQSRVDLDIFKQALKRCRNFIVNRLGSLHNRTGFRRVYGSMARNTSRIVPFRFSNDEQYLLLFLTENKLSYDPTTSPSGVPGLYPGVVLRGGVEVATFSHPFPIEDLFDVKFTQVRDIMTFTHKNHRPRELSRSNDGLTWTMSTFETTAQVSPPTLAAGTVTPSTSAPTRDWKWVATSVSEDGQESLPSAEFDFGGSGPFQVNDSTAPAPRFTITAPTSGKTPVEYNFYRGRNGYYGYVGSTDTTGSDAFEDTGVAPSYGDGPPVGKDPFGGSTVGAYSTENESFVGPICTLPVGAINPYNDIHTVSYSISVPEFASCTVLIERNDISGGLGWQTVATKTYSQTGYYQPVTYSYGTVYVFVQTTLSDSVDDSFSPMIAGDQYRVTVFSGTGTLTPLEVSWEEATGAGVQEFAYPSSVCFFEQRIVFGGFSDEPSRVVTSRTGDFRNFDTSDFVKDAESVELYLASGKMDEIRDLVPLRAIISLTSEAEWSISGADGPLSPSAFNVAPQTYNGCSTIGGLALDGEVFFVTRSGKTIKSLTYSQDRDALQAQQVNVQCSHLFTGNVKSWSWSDNDDSSIVWVVLDDGTLLSLTYMPAYEVAAWSKHETNGRVEDVQCIVEGGVWQTYILVERPHYWTAIGGSAPTQSVPSGGVELERLSPRSDSDARFGSYLDSCAVYSGINEDVAVTMTPSANDATNPSFETGGLTGWTTVSSAAPGPIVVYDPANADDGDYVCFFRTFYTSFGPVTAHTALEQSFTGVVGKDTEASFRLMPITSVESGAIASLYIDDGSGSYGTAVATVDCGSLTPDEWVTVSGSKTATGVAVRVKIELKHNGWTSSKTQDAFIDNVIVSASGLKLTCSTGFFTSAMVGDRIYLRDPIPSSFPSIDEVSNAESYQDDPYIFEITAYIDANNVNVDAIYAPESVYGVATVVWSRARRNFTITGTPGDSVISHLQHQDVSFLADGVPGTTHINYALDNPVTTETITFDLGRHAEYVILGHNYSSLIETLTIPEARNKKKLLSKLSVDVAYSRGFKAGPSEDELTEHIVVDADEPYIPRMRTELMELQVTQAWQKRGTMIIVSDTPTPLKIQSVGMEVTASAIP